MPVPMNAPMVSNVSETLNARIVISTMGSFVMSANREGSPAGVKMTPTVVGSAAQASRKETVSAIVVTPMGIPTTVAITIPIRIAPGTLRTRSTIVRARPIRKSQSCGSLKVASAGTPESNLINPTFRSPI